jgi:hypothetical protein
VVLRGLLLLFAPRDVCSLRRLCAVKGTSGRQLSVVSSDVYFRFMGSGCRRAGGERRCVGWGSLVRRRCEFRVFVRQTFRT